MSFTSKLTNLAAAGVGGDSYWANIVVNGDDRQSNLNWIAVGADKQVYFGGYYHQDNGYNRADIMELDADGNYVRGIRNGTGSQDQTNSWGGTVGTSGYIVTGGYDLSSYYDPAFFIRNPNANSYLNRYEDSPNVFSSTCRGMHTIGNYIYACVQRQISSSDHEVVVVRGSGTTFSSRSRGFLNDAGDGLEVQDRKCDVTADSNGYMYITAESSYSGSEKFYIASLNTNFSNRWIFSYARNHQVQNHRLLTDSNDNVYIIAHDGNPSTKGVHVIKFNSAGTLQYQKKVWAGGNDTDSYQINGAAIDSNDNIIVMVHSLNEPSTNNYIFNFDFIKINSSGTVTDGCRWRGNNSGKTPLYSDEKERLALDENDNIYACWNYMDSSLSDSEHRRRFVAKFTFDTQSQNVGGAFTFDPTNYYLSSATSTYLNEATRDNSPNIVAQGDDRSISSSGVSYTDDQLTLNTDVTESLTSL